MHAFAKAAGIKPDPMIVPKTVLTLEQFKRGWLGVADVEAEMEKRGIKPDRSRFGSGRNRERLYRFITDQEVAYFRNLEKMNEVVEKVKHDARQKKDAKRSKRKEFLEHVELERGKFEAIRGMEKRLLIKREQEERNKKRNEEKVLRNRLLQEKAEAKENANSEIKKKSDEKEVLRLDQIRAQGLDKLDLAQRELRAVPEEIYGDVEAQERLSYVQWLDLSFNKLENLPAQVTPGLHILKSVSLFF
jgi:hypothetical protein